MGIGFGPRESALSAKDRYTHPRLSMLASPWRNRSLLAFVLFCGSSVMSAAPAFAQTGPRQGTAEADRRARALYAEGQQAFQQEDYATAAARFEAAYALSPRAVLLLYNLGITYDRLQMPQQALEAYEHYLQQSPDASERDEVEARLRVLRADAEIARERAEQGDGTPRIVSERVVYREVQVPQEPARGWRTAGIILGSVTGVGAAATVTVALLANRYFQMLRADCGDTGHMLDPNARWCSQVEINDVQLRATLTNALMFSSIGLGVATIVAFTVDATRQRTMRTVRVRTPASTNDANGAATPSSSPAPTAQPTLSVLHVGVAPEWGGASVVVGGRF